eukprot:8079693-Pyramimonas_sp.AAC.1
MRTPPLGPEVEFPMGPRSVVLGWGNSCEHRHRGIGCNSLWGHETLPWVGETHANTATGALSGAR